MSTYFLYIIHLSSTHFPCVINVFFTTYPFIIHATRLCAKSSTNKIKCDVDYWTCVYYCKNTSTYIYIYLSLSLSLKYICVYMFLLPIACLRRITHVCQHVSKNEPSKQTLQNHSLHWNFVPLTKVCFLRKQTSITEEQTSIKETHRN